MRVVAVSDQHGHLPAIPACDLLLIAGDICPTSDHGVAFQAAWLDTDFRRWLEGLHGHVRRVVGVAGNHDFVFQDAPQAVPRDLPWTYLQDAQTTFEGLRIWGAPWQPWFHDWAFNLRAGELARKWVLIPDGTDVLVVHGPPLGYGDPVPGMFSTNNAGCRHLLARVEEVRPRLCVFGHIHEGRGVWRHGPTTLANVTLLDVKYRMVHEPWVTEL